MIPDLLRMLEHTYIDAHDVAARYLDNALEPELRAEFEAHLASCEECQDRLELARLMKQDAEKAHQEHVRPVVDEEVVEQEAVLDRAALAEIVQTETEEESATAPIPEAPEAPPAENWQPEDLSISVEPPELEKHDIEPQNGPRPATREKFVPKRPVLQKPVSKKPVEQDPWEGRKNVSLAARNLARAIDWEVDQAQPTAEDAGLEDVREESLGLGREPAAGVEPEKGRAPEVESGESAPDFEVPAEATKDAWEFAESQPDVPEAQPSLTSAPVEEAPVVEPVVPEGTPAAESRPETAKPEPSGPAPLNSDEPLKIQLVTQFKPWQIAFLLIAAGGILIALLVMLLVLETSG